MKPLALAEVREYAGEGEDKKALHDYLKNYCKLSLEKAEALMNDIKALGNVKIKEEYVVKIADFLPKDAEEVHKIFSDVSLDEAEVNAILDVVKKY